MGWNRHVPSRGLSKVIVGCQPGAGGLDILKETWGIASWRELFPASLGWAAEACQGQGPGMRPDTQHCQPLPRPQRAPSVSCLGPWDSLWPHRLLLSAQHGGVGGASWGYRRVPNLSLHNALSGVGLLEGSGHCPCMSLVTWSRSFLQSHRL